MTDLPANRYIEEALRRLKSCHPISHVKKYDGEYDHVLILARMIEKYEPIPEPVDPDLLIAREAADCFPGPNYSEGLYDDELPVMTALRAIKLAREKGEL